MVEMDRVAMERNGDSAEREAAGGAGASPRWKLIAGVTVIGALIVLSFVFPVRAWLQSALQWIEDQGLLGAAVYFALYVAATVAFVPGLILTLGAGAIYGVLKGTALVSVSSTAGAGMAFLVGRYVARGWVETKIQGNDKFKSVDDAVAREGWKIVALTRLSPVFPFNFLNYAFGLTQVSFWAYFFASWIAMLPGTLMYVYLGDAAGSLATLGEGAQQDNPLKWMFYAVGLAATIAVTVYVTHIARKALSKRVDVALNEEA